ncbi:MAG: DinB family protein [Candidatus Planktophila sp.]
MTNPIVERSLKHMAWANEHTLNILTNLPDEAINFSAWNPDWTVGKIVHHILGAQGRLIARITGQPAPEELAEVTTAHGISELIPIFKERDARILSLSSKPEEMLSFVLYGNEVEFLTSTLIVQSVHHATEHRAQIADILAANKMDALNLDAISLFPFEKWQRTQ